MDVGIVTKGRRSVRKTAREREERLCEKDRESMGVKLHSTWRELVSIRRPPGVPGLLMINDLRQIFIQCLHIKGKERERDFVSLGIVMWGQSPGTRHSYVVTGRFIYSNITSVWCSEVVLVSSHTHKHLLIQILFPQPPAVVEACPFETQRHFTSFFFNICSC